MSECMVIEDDSGLRFAETIQMLRGIKTQEEIDYEEAWKEVNAIAPGWGVKIDSDGHIRLGDYRKSIS